MLPVAVLLALCETSGARRSISLISEQKSTQVYLNSTIYRLFINARLPREEYGVYQRENEWTLDTVT